MPIRLSGINSGTDTDAMIKKIMDAQRTRLNKVEGKKTKLEWILKCLYNQEDFKHK